MTETGIGLNDLSGTITSNSRSIVSSTDGLCGLISPLLLINFPKIESKDSESKQPKRDQMEERFTNVATILTQFVHAELPSDSEPLLTVVPVNLVSTQTG
jgi:hypothetical protein